MRTWRARRLGPAETRPGRSCPAWSETHEACSVEDCLNNARDECAAAEVGHVFGDLYGARDDHVVVADHVLVVVVGAALERVGGAAKEVAVQGRVDVGQDGQEAEGAARRRGRADGRERVEVVSEGDEFDEACADAVPEDAEALLKLAYSAYALLRVVHNLAEEERPRAEADFGAARLGDGPVVDGGDALRLPCMLCVR